MADSKKPKQGVQGVEIMHPKEEGKATKLDVVFIPGLGADPLTSWQSEKTEKTDKTSFNWAFDKQGLLRDYPDARIFLYHHQSAFHGAYKIENYLDNLATTLLNSLKSKRAPDSTNPHPLVFIGHSMGGLIIAKAIALMESRRDLYKKMLESTAGCIFFGTPFLGAEVAATAQMFASQGEMLGMAVNSSLLDFMKPESKMLEELMETFHRLVTRTGPDIGIHCFWEQYDTKASDVAKKMIGFNLFPMAKDFKTVSRRSATFNRLFDNTGLLCNHRDLVKFDDPKDPRFEVVRAPLQEILHGAVKIAKNRMNASRDTNVDGMNNITKALGGGMVYYERCKALELKFGSSSWLPNESEFQGWLARNHDPQVPHCYRDDSLWICGAEGKGKTGASIAALKTIESAVKAENQAATGRSRVLLAYWFCEPNDSSTAENLLKSIIWQLIQDEPTLASYAKQFTDRKNRQAMSLSIENLWQCLQDIFSDLTASSGIYIVISNIHNLSNDSGSKQKLLDLIKDELDVTKDRKYNRTCMRWFFTSRKDKYNVDGKFSGRINRVIDLDDAKYMNQVQLELRKHAQRKVAELSSEKGYKKDLTYFVTSLIGNRAKDSGWIDITVDQLGELDKVESALRVRKKLKTLPQNLDDLLNDAWKQIFDSNPGQVDVITEMLRALVLAYEDPTLEDLAILAGEESLETLRSTVGLCSSFLTITSIDEREDVVCFKNDVAKPHLLRHAATVLGLSKEETQWQQGELALRSLAHLIERYTLPEELEKAEDGEIAEDNLAKDQNDEETKDDDEVENKGESSDAESSKDIGENEDKEENEDDENEEDDDDDDDSDDSSSSSSSSDDFDYQEELEAEAFPYMVKHWLHHASKATEDMAADQMGNESWGKFWGKTSLIRQRWLKQYKNISTTFRLPKNICVDNWTALHVAVSFGYQGLVTALIENGHDDELNKYEDEDYAPIHLAATYGRYNIARVLLKKGAAPDDVKDNKETPLAMASGEGNIEIMELLLDAKADVNAKCISSGYELHVINCAIGSGKLEPVKLLVEKGAAVHSDNNCPLDWAAAQPDRKVFDYLLKVGHKDLQPYDYGMALKCAAEYGNADVFATLLEFEHEQHYLQEALDTAAGENEWDIVRLMLNKHKGLECDTLFTAVAAATEDLEELLTLVWDYASGSISQEALDKALYQATDNEKEVTVKNLLALGASANAAGSEYIYGNALTAAAYDGQLDIVQMLLDAKAHVNSKDGWALQTAAGQGHLPVVELLLQAGADVNACTDSTFFPQGTALQAAVESGKSDIVSFLLSKNADPNLGSGEYVCPIIAAACKAEGTILEQLIAADANVNVDGGTEYTSAPLINAAQSMDVKYVEMLLDKGADINHADVDGDTALICAASSGDQPCLELLLKRGADIRHVSARRGSVLQAALRAGQDTCVEFLIDYVTENIFLKEKKDTEPNVNENIVEKDSEAEVESNNSQANDTVEDKSALNTDKWVEAPKNTYDGDDWEHYDQYKQYGTTPAPLQPQPQPPPGYDHKFNQSGTTSINNDRHKHHELQGTIQTEVQTSNAPFSIPTPPFESQRYHGVGRTPSPQHLPPQNQNYGQQYDTHHNQQYQQQQQPYEIPPPQQSIYNPPPVERYSYQAYPPQDRLQSGQQQQFGAPPPLPSRESQPPPEQYPYQAYPQQNRVQSGQFGTPPPQQSIGRKPLPEQNSYQAYPPQNRMQYGQRQQQQHGANTPPSVPPGNNHSAYW